MKSVGAKNIAFRSLVRLLRDRCPTLVPVRVRRVPLQKCLGDCVPVWDEKGRLKHFSIRIHSGMSLELQRQILIHEWAHAVAWVDGHECVDDHDEMWGIAYSRCYREVE